MNLLHRAIFGSRDKTAVNATKNLCIYNKICGNIVNVQNMRMLEYICESISRKTSVRKQFALYHCVVRHKMCCSEYLTLMAQNSSFTRQNCIAQLSCSAQYSHVNENVLWH